MTLALARLWRIAVVFLVVATAQLAAPRAHALAIQNLTQWSDLVGGNNHYYGFVPIAEIQLQGSSWTAAGVAANAVNLGSYAGHLATFSNAAELGFVLSNVLPAATSPAQRVFAGGKQALWQMVPTAGWSWVEGPFFTYTNWAVAQGEPNGTLGSPDRYLAVNVGTLRGQWANVADNAPMIGFLIEFDNALRAGSEEEPNEEIPLPEPESALLLAGALAAMALIRRR